MSFSASSAFGTISAGNKAPAPYIKQSPSFNIELNLPAVGEQTFSGSAAPILTQKNETQMQQYTTYALIGVVVLLAFFLFRKA